MDLQNTSPTFARTRMIAFGLALALGCGGCATNPYARYANPEVKLHDPALAAFDLDPFYTQYADADGVPIVGSERVPAEAIIRARDIVRFMLSKRPDIRDAFIRSGGRVAIMARDETTTDLPEQRDWKKPAIDDPRLSKCERRDYAITIGLQTDREYWAARARGMGGFFTSGAAENIMAVPGTRYYGENILVHEFSHGIFTSLSDIDPAFAQAVENAYRNAKEKALWPGSYMANNVDEYWAEGTQFWFNSNKAYITDRVTIVDSDELKRRDPILFGLLAQVYPAAHRIPGDAFYKSLARMDAEHLHLDAEGKVVGDCYS